MDVWMDGWMDVWMDGRTERGQYIIAPESLEGRGGA